MQAVRASSSAAFTAIAFTPARPQVISRVAARWIRHIAISVAPAAWPSAFNRP